MKILPCKGGCLGLPALLTKSGELQTIGTVHDPVISYHCARCGKLSKIASYDVALLPDTPDPA